MDALTAETTYGRALYDAARDLGVVDEVFAEFRAVSEVFKNHPQLKKLFSLPTLSAEEKKGVARKVFGGRVRAELVNFVCILIDKRRVGAWDGIGRCLERLIDESGGLTKGIAYSVVPLEKETISSFEQKAGAALGKRVKLENRIDTAIIGGVKIYVDGKLIDASVKTRLENLKQKIMREQL